MDTNDIGHFVVDAEQSQSIDPLLVREDKKFNVNVYIEITYEMTIIYTVLLSNMQYNRS